MYASPKSLRVHTYYLPEEVERRSEVKAQAKEETQALVRAYFTEHPKASNGQVAQALGISKGTVNKYKPAELKAPPLTEEEEQQIYEEYLRREERHRREQEASKIWNDYALCHIRNYNRYRLHPIEWGRVRAHCAKSGRPLPPGCQSADDLEKLIKKYFGILYDWPLYEKCPVCGKGICIPVWYSLQRYPYCSCSEYPECDFSQDTKGEPVEQRATLNEWYPPVIDKDALRRTVEDLSKVICFDVETTGTNRDVDEVLQISVMDGNGVVLFNEYVKPKNHSTWDGSQETHGISPEMVKDCPHIDAYIPRLNEVFASAKLYVGYNNEFDWGFLSKAGVRMAPDCQWFDVMQKFAPIFGEWNSRRRDFKYQKLATCAAFYGYEPKGDFHDSLEDVRSTLHCYLEMTIPPETVKHSDWDFDEEEEEYMDLGREKSHTLTCFSCKHRGMSDGTPKRNCCELTNEWGSAERGYYCESFAIQDRAYTTVPHEEYPRRNLQPEDYRTAMQWLAVGRVVKTIGKGRRMYDNDYSANTSLYYLIEDTCDIRETKRGGSSETEKAAKLPEKIKVSEEERLLRKELGLPVTKPLRYMQRRIGGFEEKAVVAYEIVERTPISQTPALLVTMEDGEQIRVLAPYFAEMQRPSFERDMAEGVADE